MEIVTLVVLAVALSMDAFAVAICNGIVYAGEDKNVAFNSAFAFGLAQALMPALGYLLGSSFLEYIVEFDHWIALILLGFIGGKMIVDTLRDLNSPPDEGGESAFILMSSKIIILQAIATSIDALAVGVGLAVMQVQITVASAIIGGTTFVFCFIGCKLGRRLGEKFSHLSTILGGLVLIAIGVKIFMEHTTGWH